MKFNHTSCPLYIKNVGIWFLRTFMNDFISMNVLKMGNAVNIVWSVENCSQKSRSTGNLFSKICVAPFNYLLVDKGPDDRGITFLPLLSWCCLVPDPSTHPLTRVNIRNHDSCSALSQFRFQHPPHTHTPLAVLHSDLSCYFGAAHSSLQHHHRGTVQTSTLVFGGIQLLQYLALVWTIWRFHISSYEDVL